MIICYKKVEKIFTGLYKGLIKYDLSIYDEHFPL